MTATAPHHPSSAELAAFRRRIADAYCPDWGILAVGAWPRERQRGIGDPDMAGFASEARREGARERSVAVASRV